MSVGAAADTSQRARWNHPEREDTRRIRGDGQGRLRAHEKCLERCTGSRGSRSEDGAYRERLRLAVPAAVAHPPAQADNDSVDHAQRALCGSLTPDVCWPSVQSEKCLQRLQNARMIIRVADGEKGSTE